MIMKRTLWFIFFLLNSLFYLYADSENDSLLKVLDKVISERLIYTQKKEATIKELKKKKGNAYAIGVIEKFGSDNLLFIVSKYPIEVICPALRYGL